MAADAAAIARTAFANLCDAVAEVPQDVMNARRRGDSLNMRDHGGRVDHGRDRGGRGHQNHQNHLLDAHFELAVEEFERALRLDPCCAEALVLCARSFIVQARFSGTAQENVLLRRATGLFDNALRNGRGMEPHAVLQAWGHALLVLSESSDGWRKSALVADAIAKFEQGYDTRPDAPNWINPICADWDRAIKKMHRDHQEWR